MAVPAETDRLRRHFEAARTREIPAEWQRFKWVYDGEISHGIRQLRIDPGVTMLYQTATLCYYMGAPLGAVVMASTAAERWLRWRMKAPDREGLEALTKKARDDKLVSSSMAQRLDYVRKFIRNPVVHGKEEVPQAFLGMARTGRGSWEAPEGKFGLDYDAAAREAIKAFWELLRETVPGKPSP